MRKHGRVTKGVHQVATAGEKKAKKKNKIPNPNQLSVTRCDKNETKAGCADVAGHSGTDIRMWRGRLLCVSRGTVSAMSRPTLNGGKCAAGPVCGPTTDRPYCSGSSKCPLTDIAIQPSAPTGSWEELGSFQSTKMWGKRDGGLPIIEFSVMPCFSLAHVLSAQRSGQRQKEFCSSMQDPRWRRNVDKTVHSSVVRENMGDARTDSMTSQVPSHASNKGPCAAGATCYTILGTDVDMWELSYKPEIFWKTKCQTDATSRGALTKRREPMKETTVWQTMLLIFTIFNFLVMSILVGLTIANYMCGVDLPCWTGSGEEEYEKMQRHKKYCSFCCKAVTFPISLVAFLVAQGIMRFFEDVAEMKCSDSETNKHVDTLSEGITNVYTSNRNAMIMTVFAFVCELVLIVVGCVRSCMQTTPGTQVKPFNS